MWIMPLPKDHLGGSHGRRDDYDIVFHDYNGCKTKEI
jgi:hypothetical protein